MIEDHELYLSSPRARPNWVLRMLAPFQPTRLSAVPTSEYLRRDLGLGEEPNG